MPTTTYAERQETLSRWEAAGVLTGVEISSPGDGSRRYSFTVAATGERRTMFTGPLDEYLRGVEAGYSAPRSPKRPPRKRTTPSTPPEDTPAGE